MLVVRKSIDIKDIVPGAAAIWDEVLQKMGD